MRVRRMSWLSSPCSPQTPRLTLLCDSHSLGKSHTAPRSPPLALRISQSEDVEFFFFSNTQAYSKKGLNREF